MTRLTTAHRDTITSRAIAAAFRDRAAALNAEQHALGMEAYHAVVPEAERTLAAAMPDGWLRTDTCLRFNAGGWTGYLAVSPAVPVPHSSHCRLLGVIQGELIERVQAHMQADKTLREERVRAEIDLSEFLGQFKTFKHMRAAWPDGEPFYADLDADRPAAGVPAVRVAEINKLLNITPAA